MMPSTPLQIAFIGAGNLASALAPALVAAGYRANCVYSRTATAAERLAVELGCRAVTQVSDIAPAEVYIFSVTDDALATLVEQICTVAPRHALMLHTAGAVPMSIFDGCAGRYGVLYPMQTFTKGRAVDFRTIPIFIEGSDRKALAEVRQLAENIAESVTELSSERRRYLHLAAVFANNFTNHCYAIAEEILREKAGIAPHLLLPLIHETEAKAEAMTALIAQTGPAVRYDRTVMERHIDLLDEKALWADVYRTMSRSIHDMKIHNKQQYPNL